MGTPALTVFLDSSLSHLYNGKNSVFPFIFAKPLTRLARNSGSILSFYRSSINLAMFC